MPDLLAQLAGQSNEAIGLRAQLRREMLGLSQADLAERRGVSLDTVKRWEEGKRNFDGGFEPAASHRLLSRVARWVSRCL